MVHCGEAPGPRTQRENSTIRSLNSKPESQTHSTGPAASTSSTLKSSASSTSRNDY